MICDTVCDTISDTICNTIHNTVSQNFCIREPRANSRVYLQTVLGIILGGGAGSRLYPLTKKRAKPAVPLGANYRLIDIPVSNCINSNVNKIYCLTQFNSASLNRHLSQAYVSSLTTSICCQRPMACFLSSNIIHRMPALSLLCTNAYSVLGATVSATCSNDSGITCLVPAPSRNSPRQLKPPLHAAELKCGWVQLKRVRRGLGC